MQQIFRLTIFPFGMINSYLIKGTVRHILVDAGVPGSEKRIFKQLKSLGIKPEDIGLIVITHGHLDHFGSAAALKQALNVPVLVHSEDALALRSGKSIIETLKPNKAYWNILKWRLSISSAVPVEPDILLRGDETFPLHTFGIQGSVIHTPGHTAGSLSIVLDNGEAIIMDLASSGIFLGGLLFKSRVKHPPFHDDKTVVKNSINRILTKSYKRFYLGHGYPIDRNMLEHYASTML